MEKEQIISTLIEKVGHTSFSQRSFSDYVDNNLPAEGTEPDDAYWTKHVNILKSFQGNFSADMSSELTKQMPAKSMEYFVKNPDKFKEFIKAHPELVSPEPPKNDPPKDEAYKALEDKINLLIKERDEAKNEAKVNALRDTVKGKAEGLKVTRIRLWNDAAKNVSYEEGDTEESFLRKVKDRYNADFKDYYGDGEKPFRTEPNPGGGNGGNKVVSDYFAKKKAKLGK